MRVKSKAELRAALLRCMEFFRDEVEARTCDLMPEGMGRRLGERFADLRGACYEALDRPSMADVDRIKAGVN